MRLKHVLIYDSIFDIVDNLTEEQAGILFKGLSTWRKGETPIFKDPLIIGLWLGIKPNLDKLEENYNNTVERNRKNGSKGGRPKTQENPNNPSGFLETHSNPENLKEKEKDKDKDKDKEKEKEKEKTRTRENWNFKTLYSEILE